MGNYTTPEEIGETRELQQVTTTVPDAAKRCRFYRVELLNGASTGRGEKRRQIDGNGAKMVCVARAAKRGIQGVNKNNQKRKGLFKSVLYVAFFGMMPQKRKHGEKW